MLTVETEEDRTTCRCLGKILIAGGYCVLDPRYCGLVICPSQAVGECQVTRQPSNQNTIVEVRTANFPNYSFKMTIDDAFSGLAMETSDQNKFVEDAVTTAVKFIAASKEFNASMSRYHYSLQLRLAEHFYGVQPDGGKTGLGSSAVVTVLIIASLLHCFGVVVENHVLFNLAYKAHSNAQGKLGSGFDIAAGIYGTQLFQRNQIICKEIEYKFQRDAMEDHLPNIKLFQLPSFLDVSLVSIGAGSSTSGLVGRFKQWEFANMDERTVLFDKIDECTRLLHSSLINENANGIKRSGKTILDLYRQLTVQSGCEIMPKLVYDCCMRLFVLDSVYSAGIAGAGGYDAFYVLYERTRLESILPVLNEFSFTVIQVN